MNQMEGDQEDGDYNLSSKYITFDENGRPIDGDTLIKVTQSEVPYDMPKQANRAQFEDDDDKYIRPEDARPDYVNLGSIATGPDYVNLGPRAMGPDYANLGSNAIGPDYANLGLTAMGPDYATLDPIAIENNYENPDERLSKNIGKIDFVH